MRYDQIKECCVRSVSECMSLILFQLLMSFKADQAEHRGDVCGVGRTTRQPRQACDDINES